MGTHISRVKSVDLDSWTDEQLQSILSWGNARANKYWEAKLAPGHAPSEAKIENFIRTKYELKRWVMDGPMPDPSTLDADGDDDVPLSVVKEKQSLERRESVRKASVGQSAAPRPIRAPAPAPQPDLIGGDPIPQRPSTTGPVAGKVPPKAEPAPPKATNTKDSLLGLDFLGTEPAQPPRPASTTGTSSSGGQSRPDLKQSILSLYATAPRPQPQVAPQHATHSPSASLSGMSSPGMNQQQSAFGGLNDAFSGLSFATSPPVKSPQNDAFSSLGSFTSPRPSVSQPTNSAFSSLSGGSFFDSKPPAASTSHQKQPSTGSSMGGFGGLTSPTYAPKPAPAQPASSAMADLFDFSSTPAPAPAAPKPAASPAPASSSVFNLSAKPLAATTTTTTTTTSSSGLGAIGGNNWSDANVWGSSNEWSTPAAPVPAQKSPEISRTSAFASTSSTTAASADDFGGWGAALANPIVPAGSGGFAPAPKVAADEEFGGWTSSTGPSTSTTATSKPAAGGFGGEDLFSNVWQ